MKKINAIKLDEQDFSDGKLNPAADMAFINNDVVLSFGHVVKNRYGNITALLEDIPVQQNPAKENEGMTEGEKFAKEWAEGMREASQKPPEPLQESYPVKHQDPELHAMSVCIEAMTRHLGKDAAARVRVLEYLHARLRLPKTL